MDSPNIPNNGGFRQFGVKFYRYKTLVKKNWWILALTAAAGLAYQGWIVSRKPILYESTGKLNIREELNNVTDKQKFSVPPETFVGTTLALLKSDEVITRANHRIALEHPELAGDQAELLTAVLPRTYIFTITARGKNPAFVPVFADAVREEFVAMRDEQRLRSMSNIAGGIVDQIKTVETALNKARDKRDSFSRENNMGFWADQAKQASDSFTALKTEQASLQTRLQRLEKLTPEELLYMPSSSMAIRGADTGSANPAAESTAMSQDLQSKFFERTQELGQLRARIKEQQKIWKPKHPKMKDLIDQEGELEAAVELIRQQSADQSAQQVKAIKVALSLLEKDIAEQSKKIQEASSMDAQFKMLSDDVIRIEAELAHKREEAIELNPGAGKGDIFVKLGEPSSAVQVPKGLAKNLLVGLMGGLVIGVAILIFRDRADDRLTSSAEMMEQFNEPILGQIPDVMNSRDSNGLPLLQIDDERYSFAEAFRSLRSSLIFMPNQPSLQTLLVTSAIPNEGKSTITSNLGITMAAAGANIVLVDADLRRGDLASLFDMDGRTGLSNVLRGEVSWRDAAQTTKYPGLTLIPRGPVTNQSSELLLLPSLEKLLDELKDEFDLVLFNTAPILATDDTSSLSPHFDGTLMVVRAQFTSARLTHNALNALYQRQVNVLGLILNCVDTDMPDYYYYRYPKYYAAQ